MQRGLCCADAETNSREASVVRETALAASRTARHLANTHTSRKQQQQQQEQQQRHEINIQ